MYNLKNLGLKIDPKSLGQYKREYIWCICMLLLGWDQLPKMKTKFHERR